MNYRELIFNRYKGTTQYNRFKKPLDPSYAQIDGRTLADLLALVSKYAKHINYYNSKHEVTDNWHSFLINDISIILANIVATDLKRVEKAHRTQIKTIQATYDFNNKVKGLDDLVGQIFSLLQEIDTWYTQVTTINIKKESIEGLIEQELRSIIDLRLYKYLHQLINYVETVKATKFTHLDLTNSLSEFNKIWKVEEISNLSTENIYTGDTDRAAIINARTKYQLLFKNVFNRYSLIVLKFQRYFEQSIEQKSDHRPDIGLLITFLQLYKHTQADLNAISSRLLEFYYLQILGQTKRDAITDTVYITANVAAHIEEYTLPRDTKLLAGRDKNGEEILYVTKEDTTINKAKIEHLKTLYLSQRDESTTSYATINSFYAANVANSKDGNGMPFRRSNATWALFGEEQKSAASPTMTPAEIGIAITSPILFLKEGRRKVNMVFTFKESSTELYRELLNDITISKKIQQSNASDDPFMRLFPQGDNKRNISIALSGTRNWIAVSPETIKIRKGEKGELNKIRISFELPPAAPAVVAYNAANLKDKPYFTKSPIVKIVINNEKAPYLYSFIQDLVIKYIDINVAVEGIKNLQLYNDIGQLDATQPFQAFGNQPNVGSYLLVGNSEVFRKSITKLSFHLQWSKLPKTVGEYQKYYQHYEQGQFSPSKYKIDVKALSNHDFFPVNDENSVELNLFSTNTAKNTVINTSKIELLKLELDKLNIVPEPHLESYNEYDNETKSGYFKLELTQPESMFGHTVYPKLFAEIVTKNAKKSNDEKALDIPNEPYTPIVKNIHLNYEATVRLDTGDYQQREHKIFHVHPFGVERIYPNKKARQITYLLPHYEEDAYLYIGLKDALPSQHLSLLFQLTASESKGNTIYNIPTITWSYLRNNEWYAIKDTNILMDTTDNFTKTGVVRMKLPNDISNRNNILPNGVCWLRVAIHGDIEVLCKAIDIKTQIVECEWLPTSDDRLLEEPLPPYSIDRLLYDKPEIASISQPFESFGGLPKEDFKAFSSRVSEYLRHKGRAITKWDYERMVLERFHEIEQVKCLNFLDSYVEEEVGTTQNRTFDEETGVVIVVIPKRQRYLEDNKPRVNYQMLQKIEEYLHQRVSPFAKLRIRNPNYEYLRIVADVKFTTDKDTGRLLQRFKRDLNKFISPWLFYEKKIISIGAIIEESSVQDYIRGLDYVAFLTKFSMLHIIKEDDGKFALNDTATEPKKMSVVQTRPWGVFIPDEHEINIIEDYEHELPKKLNNVLFQNSWIIKDGHSKRKNYKRIIRIKQRPHYNLEQDDTNNENYQLKITLDATGE